MAPRPNAPWLGWSLLAVASLAACAGTPGAQPHEMSVATHETTAAEQERAAAAHTCAGQNGSVRADVCWTSVTTPTPEEVRKAGEHRHAAAEHRAAAQSLRDAESRACAGLSPADRDESPFDHTEDIERVEPLYGRVSGNRGAMTRPEGAVITFRAVPGMTAQWLQRLVNCHLARNAALGHDVREMPHCPLVPRGASASVSATDSGFAVAIRGDSEESAKEILRRAQSLVAK